MSSLCSQYELWHKKQEINGKFKKVDEMQTEKIWNKDCKDIKNAVA